MKRAIVFGFLAWMLLLVAALLMVVLHRPGPPMKVSPRDTGPVIEDIDFGFGFLLLDAGVVLTAIAFPLGLVTLLKIRRLSWRYRFMGFFPLALEFFSFVLLWRKM